MINGSKTISQSKIRFSFPFLSLFSSPSSSPFSSSRNRDRFSANPPAGLKALRDSTDWEWIRSGRGDRKWKQESSSSPSSEAGKGWLQTQGFFVSCSAPRAHFLARGLITDCGIFCQMLPCRRKKKKELFVSPRLIVLWYFFSNAAFQGLKSSSISFLWIKRLERVEKCIFVLYWPDVLRSKIDLCFTFVFNQRLNKVLNRLIFH